ncbi:Tannase/feruloyl esterase [Mariannaea sp. PMI_226]|nr:Tannase/feruloyl esterase [Mariannaea sp. PMI_226]
MPGREVVCENIPKPHIDGAEVQSISSTVLHDYTVPAFPPYLLTDVHNINVCEVNITLTHSGQDDLVTIQTWLPIRHWNQGFIATGGSAWLAGLGTVSLAQPAASGYMVSSTDAGLAGHNPLSPASWALKKDGTMNTALLTNFASRSIHDMAVIGKSLASSFYGQNVQHSFWNGCSTGGRQGLVAAQQYPHDFDGILAGAPALNWTEYVIAELWPQVVMKEAGYYPLPCEFDTVVQKAIEACDKNDGVKDNVISDPFGCRFDPASLIGTKAQSKTASIIRRIWDGPKAPDGTKLWSGLPVGANLNALAGTTNVTGHNGPNPFFLADQWASYFVKENPKFNTGALSESDFLELFAESRKKFSNIMDSADPDIRAFKKAGGKLLVWHGLADQLIYPQDSIHYLKAVEQKIGSHADTANFFRLFLAPGVDHCGYGAVPSAGAIPVDPFAALVSWVQDGTPPEELQAETAPTAKDHFTRKVCRYPLKATYIGHGDAGTASNYRCS